ncbi:HEPN domain-containing protein [Halocatena pleomorpha]|nr:HEPN domain-containing protein [Halocatena pleomorpha]
MPDSPSPPDPVIELELAYDALNEADVLRKQGGDRGAISRLYYACFHAAQAVLYDRGFDPQTHGTAIRWFGQEVVVPGDASEAAGSFFNEMYDLRTEADYKPPPTANVEALYVRTEVFIDDMAALLGADADTGEE